MKKRNLFQNIKEILIVIGRAIKSAFRRTFFGTRKEMTLLEEEAVQSPLKVTAKKFIKNKLAITGLVVFLSVILFCFVGSIFVKADIYYVNITQANTGPGFSLLSVPKELQANGILDIAVAATYSVGIDKQNNVYIWGIDINDMAEAFPGGGAAPTDIKRGKELVKDLKATRVWSGNEHFILEQMDGSLVSFGLVTETISFNHTTIPTNLAVKNAMGMTTYVNVVDAIAQDGGVLEVIGENQVTMVITKKNRVFMWGNTAKRPYNIAIALKNLKAVSAGFSRENITFLLDSGKIKVVGTGSVASNIPEVLLGDDARGKQLITTAGSAVVLRDDGTIVAWGDNLSKELDFDPRIQGHVVKLSKAAVGSDNYQHFSAVLDDGSVYSWGSTTYGAIKVPKALANGTKAAHVYSSFFQNYATDADGKLLGTWGLKGHLFGTDEYGRDVFARVINGGRISLTIGLIAVIISTTIGIIIGGISGFYGGKVDILLMRFAEIVGSIPFFPLAMTLSAILNQVNPNFDTTDRMIMIMVILGVLSWTGLAALIRAQILSEREKEFVVAAKALGVRSRAIIFKHIIPNVLTIIIINATLSYASSLLTESGLSFLGFGVQLPAPSWGNMLSGAQEMDVIKSSWWRWVFPSIFLCISTISINVIGDAIRDAVDPRSRER
ncbi:MAG TPA: ABC transporter permease subunit [Bacilli bacterium]|nr:ABC transporter permease subunit [Bacilli bacterium]